MARHRPVDVFPAPLREFREAEWPPVPGEHLGHYWCCGPAPDPAPEPGEACGDRCYAMLTRDHPDRPEVVAAAKRADAFTRYHQARLSWLAEDDPAYVGEVVAGWRAYEKIRYAPFREEGAGGAA
jgi:hypothetical protein